MFRPPGDCPVCDEFVPEGYQGCPHCSADERSGWKDDTAADGLDLPDDDFNYEEFVQNEFGKGSKSLTRGLHPVWWITGLILLILSLIALLTGPS